MGIIGSASNQASLEKGIFGGKGVNAEIGLMVLSYKIKGAIKILGVPKMNEFSFNRFDAITSISSTFIH